jgi:mannose-6-phosphate isomerase
MRAPAGAPLWNTIHIERERARMRMAPTQPLLLQPLLVERVWGRRDLGGWAGTGRTAGDLPVGEAWLTDVTCRAEDGTTLGALSGANAEDGVGTPLLAKLLFTDAPLSVQVHPTDAAAAAAGVASGKDEAWLVLEALPGAVVWIGFREPITADALRAAAADGSVLALMRRHPARVGETILVPAGTVHAIGAGLVVLEVQDAIDVTWRLYDHARPRTLQLDAAMAVADLGASRAVVMPAAGDPRQLVATAPRFVLERLSVLGGLTLRPDGSRQHIMVALTDGVTMDDCAVPRGLAAFIPAAGATTRITGAPGAMVALLHGGPGPTPCIAVP